MSNEMKNEEQNVSKTKSLGQLLKDNQKQIEAALPKHLDSRRMLRIAMTEIRKNPDLQKCTAASLVGAIIQCSQLGVEPGGSLGHSYLIPYKKNKNIGTKDNPNWKTEFECQFMLGYRGMIDIARRSGKIVSINAHCIYSNEIFEFEYGLVEHLRHVPAKENKGFLIGAYAVAHLVGGGHQTEVMFKEDIEKIRSRSASAKSTHSPWVTDYDEMARKTVVRRLFKYLPVSIEFMDAITMDDAAEKGEQNNSGILFDGEYELKEASEIEMGVSKTSKADEVNDLLKNN